MNTRYCSKCKQELPITEFHKNKSVSSGYHSHCKACKKTYDKKYRDLPHRVEIENERGNDRRLNDWRTRLWAAKMNAQTRGQEFSIDIEDVPIPDVCPLLGMPLRMGETYRWNKPSIDRIDSTKGYIKGNVWVISVLANTMKSIATKEQLVTFSKNCLKYFDN